MGVSKNRDNPKWMVYNGNPYQKKMIWGVPLFSETPICNLLMSFCAWCYWWKKTPPIEMDNATVLIYIPQYEYIFVSSYWPKLRMNQQLGVCGWYDCKLSQFRGVFAKALLPDVPELCTTAGHVMSWRNLSMAVCRTPAWPSFSKSRVTSMWNRPATK